MGSRDSKTRAREGGASVFTSFVFLSFLSVPPSEKSAGGFQQAGKKEGGWGEGIFARLPKRSPAALLVQSRTPKKSFVFLLEEKIGRAQNQKYEQNFSLVWRASASGGGVERVSSAQNGFVQSLELSTIDFRHFVLGEAQDEGFTLRVTTRRGGDSSRWCASASSAQAHPNL